MKNKSNHYSEWRGSYEVLHHNIHDAALAILMETKNNKVRVMIVDSRRRERIEDAIRMAHYPRDLGGFSEHISWGEAKAYVKKVTDRWLQASPLLRRGMGTPYCCSQN